MRFSPVPALLLAAGLATSLFAAQPAAVETKVLPLVVVKAARLVEPVTGRVLADQAVVIQGDRIKAVYTENLTIRIETSGDVDMTVERMRSDAKPGANPSMSWVERTIYKATISAINLEKGTAMLKDPTGEESEVTPLQPENLKRVKVGDIVVITAMQTMALSLDKDTSKKAPAKKAAKK